MIVEARETASSIPVYIYETTFNVAKNYNPEIGTGEDKTITVPNSVSWNYGTSWIVDPEGLDFNVKIKVNGDDPPSWLIIDYDNYSFSVASTTNDINGTYTIKVQAKDEYNLFWNSESFTLIIIPNDAPQAISSFEEFVTVREFNFVYQLKTPEEYFVDPEGTSLSLEILQIDSFPLPEFMEFHDTTNKITGFVTSEDDIKTWMLAYIVTDVDGFSSNITFEINIRDCYFRCSK